MMTSALALLAGLTATPAAMPASLPDIFIAACLDGEARLPAGSATRVRFEDLPPDLQQRLRTPASGSVWRLAGMGQSYLYTLDYDSARVSPRICGLASDAMSLEAASNAIDRRLTGQAEMHYPRGTQWPRPQDGYQALATTAAGFRVMQVNWMNPRDRAAYQASLRSVAR